MKLCALSVLCSELKQNRINNETQPKESYRLFDLETTGTNINSDRIVEICYLKVYPNGNEESKTLRINPEMPIPAESSAVHGIYDADVADCPTFKEVAKSIANDIEGCDLAGFNSNRFDIPVLAEEFLRAGVDIDMSKRKFVDVQVISIRWNSVPLRLLISSIVAVIWKMRIQRKLIPVPRTRY